MPRKHGCLGDILNSSQLYKKILILSLILFFALGALGLGIYGWWSSQGEPEYSGQIALVNLQSEVSVEYDQSGIPHIKASNEADLFRTLGRVMAQDRLFQMDLLRRVVRGELAEVFGASALKVDILFRSLGLIYGFQERLENGEVDAHVTSLMEAFYDGVNQYIDEGNWPYEYKLLGMAPKKFEVIDGYGILGYMSYSFAQAFKVDLLLDKIKKEKGEEFANSLRGYPLKLSSKKVSALSREQHLWQEAHQWLEENIGMFEGSNAWALSGHKSSSSRPLLASDPHVQYSLPGIWYEAVVDWGKGPFSGLFVPAVPFAAMGHNRLLGWGVTISYIDDMDFYREKIDGENLFYKGQWLPLEKRHEVIKVKDGDDHEMDLYWGVHGPILDQVHPLEEGKLAMKWGHFDSSNRAPMAFYRMMNATNIDSFKDALQFAKSPGLNIVYADQAGHIGRYLFGSLPLRPEHMTGDLIYEGESGLYDWLGDMDFFDRAHIEDPESGIISSANQKPEATDLPGYYQPDDRYETIKSLLGAKEKWSLEELKYLQTSSTSIFTFPLRDQILRAYDFAKDEVSAQEKKLLEMLRNWDGVFTEESVAASLFQQTLVFAGEELLAPAKEYYLDYCDTNFYSQHIKKRILRDNPYQELIIAVRKTIELFNKRYGDWSQVRWGDIHTLTVTHPLSKGGKILGFIFNFGPYPISGAMDTINNIRRVGCRDEFSVKAGPSSRRLIDFLDAEKSWAIVPTGNSGHWKSPFFSNQWELYRDGKYRESLLKSHLSDEERFSKLKVIPKVK